MTPDEQRIAIAEASQGKIELYESVWYYWSETKRFPCKDNDPINDLNAIHEAENALDEAQCERFKNWLHEVSKAPIWGAWNAVHATAAQRAEAFLRTLNLWK